MRLLQDSSMLIHIVILSSFLFVYGTLFLYLSFIFSFCFFKHLSKEIYLNVQLLLLSCCFSLMDKETESAARHARRAVELAPSNEETVSLLEQIQKRLEPDRVC